MRKKAEGLKSSGLVLEQWIFFPASREERDLHMVEKNIQALASGPGPVSYLFVFLVFFVHQEGDHSDKYGQADNRDQGTICHS